MLPYYYYFFLLGKKQCKLLKVKFAPKCKGVRENVPNIFFIIIQKLLILSY